MAKNAKSSGKKYRKKGESEKLSQSRDAAAHTSSGGSKRIDGVRWLSVEDAIRKASGSGPKAKQRRRLGL